MVVEAGVAEAQARVVAEPISAAVEAAAAEAVAADMELELEALPNGEKAELGPKPSNKLKLQPIGKQLTLCALLSPRTAKKAKRSSNLESKSEPF